MMSDKEKFEYWMDIADKELGCFTDKEKVKTLFVSLMRVGLLRHYELPNQEGIVAYMIGDNFRGSDCVNELFMYIKREHRGNIRLFKKLVNHLEQIAKENNCVSVKIASNIGYNDDSVLRCLQRFGYKTDVVIKEIR